MIDTSQTFMYNASDGKFYLQKNGGGRAGVDIATDTTSGIVAVGDGLEIDPLAGILSVTDDDIVAQINVLLSAMQAAGLMA